MLNVPIHSPTSGWVKDIFYDVNLIDKNEKYIKIVILSDHLDKWIKIKPVKNYKQYTSEKLIKIIYQAGVVGLGGGQFSSAKKLILSIKKANTLIVNAVESEPYITADNCLISNYINEILEGCKIISWISQIKVILIAVQEDRVESISKIFNFIKNKPLFKLCILKKKYPGGSSKVLIKSLTGEEIPYGKHSTDIGYLVFNVATIYAIKRAIINGEPLTERIVTILSDKKNILSGNFWIRIGTPIKYFLTNIILKKYFFVSVYVGGPFMGERICNINYSVLKKTHCISFKFEKEQNKNKIENECIRCGYCAQVCPVNLLPQQLYWYSKKNNHEQSKKHHILDCIECKACEKVCPSYILLVKYFKKEKSILKDIELEKRRKKLSFIRFKKREERLYNEKKIISLNNIHNEKTSFTKIKNANINNIEKNTRKKIIEEAIKRIKFKK